MRRLAPILALAAALAGCGLGPGSEQAGSGVELAVTRDFGSQTIRSASSPKVRASDTVMRLLQRNAKVTTRYGGGFVQSIEGIAGTEKGGRRDWFYFVNGVEAPTGAADRELHPGDVVQWDYRTWEATPHVPAIVGAFPEPFLHGQEGEHYPTRVECGDSANACDIVRAALDDARVPAGSGALGASARGGVLRIVVGKWSELSRHQDVGALSSGPSVSGVYARMRSASGSFDMLDTRGRAVRSAPPGSGLVAALLPKKQQPLWVVTGNSEAGVERAARLLTKAKLRNAYAVAALPTGPERLPLEPAG